jgi:hypothetical protein
MAQCQRCGNDYDKTFDVIMNNKKHSFDCFECAIHDLAPQCLHCGCKIIGHGVENGGKFYCCAHCAKCAGVEGMADRINRK